MDSHCQRSLLNIITRVSHLLQNVRFKSWRLQISHYCIPIKMLSLFARGTPRLGNTTRAVGRFTRTMSRGPQSRAGQMTALPLEQPPLCSLLLSSCPSLYYQYSTVPRLWTYLIVSVTCLEFGLWSLHPSSLSSVMRNGHGPWKKQYDVNSSRLRNNDTAGRFPSHNRQNALCLMPARASIRFFSQCWEFDLQPSGLTVDGSWRKGNASDRPRDLCFCFR